MAVVSIETPLPGLALNWRQLGGFAGIAGVILFVAGVVLQGTTPVYTDSIQETRAYFDEDGQRYLVGDFIIGLGVVLGLIPFFVVLRHVLGAAEGGTAAWSWILFVSIAIYIALGAAAASFNGALALAIENIDDDGAVRAMQQASFYLFSGNSLLLVPFYAGIGFVITRTGVFWSWFGWVALVLAVVSLIGSATPIDGDPKGVLATLGFIASIGVGVSVLSLGAAMLTKPEAAALGR